MAGMDEVSDVTVLWHPEQFLKDNTAYTARALEKAGAIVEEQAKANVRTGGASGLGKYEYREATHRLENSIRHRVLSPEEAQIGIRMPGDVREGDALYGHIHEFGGVITPKTAKFLRFIGKEGAVVLTKKVVMPARPWLRPALAACRQRILEAFTSEGMNVLGP